MPIRRILVLSLLALAGLAVAVGVTTAATELTSQRIGLEAEPLDAGSVLAPARTAPPSRTTTTRTTTTPRTTTAPATVAPPAATGDDDGSGRGRGRGRNRGRGGDDD